MVIQFPIQERDEVHATTVSTLQPQPGVSNVTIQLPRPFVYKDGCQVPWNYSMQIVTTRGTEFKVEEADVDNLSLGLGGITRSGRRYTSVELKKRRKELGKTVEDP